MAEASQGRVPKRLKREPLVEVICELRLRLQQGVTGEVLGGALHCALREQFPRIRRLPAADVPRPVIRADPRWRYAPVLRLEGKGEPPLAVQVGDRVVSFNSRRPYLGWGQFSQHVHKLVELLRDTGLVEQVERFALRYIDLLDLERPPSLRSLSARVELAGYDLSALPVQLRTEIPEKPFVHIVQLTSPARVFVHGQPSQEGTLVDIETARTISQEEDGWKVLNAGLEDAHDRTHRLFFRLLTRESLEQLQPVYEE